MDHGYKIKRLLDGVAVSDLLIAAVALIIDVPQHRHPDLRMLFLVLAPDLEGAVLRAVVHDQELAVVLAENRRRDPLENCAQGRLCEICDDKNQEARSRRCALWLWSHGHP